MICGTEQLGIICITERLGIICITGNVFLGFKSELIESQLPACIEKLLEKPQEETTRDLLNSLRNALSTT